MTVDGVARFLSGSSVLLGFVIALEVCDEFIPERIRYEQYNPDDGFQNKAGDDFLEQ
jgi:hypothetical protein